MQEEILDRLLSIPAIYNGILSPNGQWLAFLCRVNASPITQLYLTRADGTGPARQLLKDTTGWDTDHFSWSYDSMTLVAAQSRDGNERERLLLVMVEDGAWSRLTEDQPDYYIHGGVLHPNRTEIIYSANCDPDTGKEIEHNVIYAQNVESGRRRVLARLKSALYDAPQISANGRYVLYGRADQHPAGHQLWLVGIDGRGDKEIANVGANAKVQGSFSPDGKYVLLRAEAATHRRIGLYDIASGKTSWLIDNPDRNIEGFYWPKASPLPILEEYQQSYLRASLFDPFNAKETPLRTPDLPGQIGLLGRNDQGQWVLSHYASQYPNRYVLGEGALDKLMIGKALSQLPETPLSIQSSDLAPAEDFHWRSVDGLEIHGLLLRARGEPRGTILYIHGGPTYHYEDEFSVQAQYLVQCGFNVMEPNYRGSTGYGLVFQESIKAHGWGGLEQEDIRSCAEALIAAGIAEKGKIGITGVSYGGYSSWWAITHFSPEIIAASIPICGMTDLVVDYEGTRPDLRPYSEEMMGGSPKQVPKRYHDHSPINFVHQIRGRLLIVQGMTDPNVTPLNLYALQKKLDQAHIPYEVLTFEDEGHGIAKPANRRLLYLRMAQFFDQAFRQGELGASPKTQQIGMGPVS